MTDEKKAIFDVWGTYRSFEKDVMIINYFLECNKNTEDKHALVRQKTIVNHFKNRMATVTVRSHLYKLLKKGIIEEDKNYRGTYFMAFYDEQKDDFYEVTEVDWQFLANELLGEAFYTRIKDDWTKKYEYEFGRRIKAELRAEMGRDKDD